MATISEPLHSLLRKGKKWTWGRTEEESWNKIKEAITRGDTLAPFETSSLMKTYLTTDASDVGIGAVLEQEQLDGGIKPVLYWSSKLRKYERNYSVSEKEALACVTAMEKCRKYLLGRRFILKTDHRALVSLLSQRSTKTSSARTERWREKVSCFDYEVEFIKGTDNNIADWLSRSATTVDHREVPLKEEFVINVVKQDAGLREIPEYEDEMKILVKIVKESDWTPANIKKFKDYYHKRDRISCLEDFLFLDGVRFIPNKKSRKEILKKAHGACMGRTRMKSRVAEIFWWPGMYR